MTKIAIPLVIASLAAILFASPISDKRKQGSAPSPGKDVILQGSAPTPAVVLGKFPGGVRDIPLEKPVKVTLDCPKEGFFSMPEKCHAFYQCVSIPHTAYFRVFNYECTDGEVFSQDLGTCVPGECAAVILEEGSLFPPNLEGPGGQPVVIQDKPYFPPGTFPENYFPGMGNEDPGSAGAPAPPLPGQVSDAQNEIVIEETFGRPPSAIKGPFNTGEISIEGIGSSLLNDNRTIRIHIPINIIQQ